MVWKGSVIEADWHCRVHNFKFIDTRPYLEKKVTWTYLNSPTIIDAPYAALSHENVEGGLLVRTDNLSSIEDSRLVGCR